MSLDFSYTDYEINYDNTLKTESKKAYTEALAAAKAAKTNKTDGILQTGNTGPGEAVRELEADERQLESVEAYLDFLQIKFSESIFTIGEFNGEASELGGIGSILISPRILEKMIHNPELRHDMEKSIAEIDEAEKNLRLWYESNNSKVLGHGAVIDADGKAKTWSFVLEDLNSMEKLGSTSSFMKLEELREKTRKLTF